MLMLHQITLLTETCGAIHRKCTWSTHSGSEPERTPQRIDGDENTHTCVCMNSCRASLHVEGEREGWRDNGAEPLVSFVLKQEKNTDLHTRALRRGTYTDVRMQTWYIFIVFGLLFCLFRARIESLCPTFLVTLSFKSLYLALTRVRVSCLFLSPTTPHLRHQCVVSNCTKLSTYGFDGFLARYCFSHKSDGMVYLKNRKR